jgi:putative transposase
MAVLEEESARHGVAACCRALQAPRASFYRWRHRRAHPVPPRRRPFAARALTRSQREEVLEVVNSERFHDCSVPEVLYTCLEEGRYLASRSTVYRLLKQENATRERRDQLSHPLYARPELLATAPNQVWSWDITKLRGPVKWVYFYLYVLLDIFSRYVVGWLIAHRESARIASILIADSCRRQGIEPGQLSLHADRGSSMRSKTLAQLLDDLQVAPSFSRPHTCNDNPFSEAQFKTLKYQPDYPDRFASIQDSRTFGRRFFPWYNTQHHHAGIAGLTPATVHFGKAQEILDRRHAVLLAAYRLHPERFVAGPPKRPQLPSAVWINPPKEQTARELARQGPILIEDDPNYPPASIVHALASH